MPSSPLIATLSTKPWPCRKCCAGSVARKIKLVVLDACRDNPFAPRKTEAPEVIARELTAGGTIVSRSTNGRGLAEVKVTGATLVVFAAKDGQVALDGEGSNSPFAVAVVQRLATPGVEINKVFRLVRDDVMEATAGRQEPYTYGSLPGKEDFLRRRKIKIEPARSQSAPPCNIRLRTHDVLLFSQKRSVQPSRRFLAIPDSKKKGAPACAGAPQRSGHCRVCAQTEVVGAGLIRWPRPGRTHML